MKRLLLAVAVLALAFPALRQAEARTDISIDFFYDSIGDDGSWVEVADYGYCWQPNVAVSNRSWRPYTDGYWAYTDVGWTWVSYEDFGWATYHYGRWVRLRGRGWIWVPGREWGPAWVSWRTGGDYVGWAPLPPRGRGGVIYDSRPITAQVDIDFDIGPLYYNFIDVRYIGEPVLRERIYAADQNVTYITKTVNVTNITYRDNQVYNYGPDYNTLSRYSTRPIQRLSLQRDTNVDPIAAVRSRSAMKVEGDRLVIAAPQTLQKSTTTVAPKVVKEKIAEAPVERGWEGVSDQKAQTELKQKMKSEDSKTVPPPTVQAVREAPAASPSASTAATSAASAPATGASPSISADKGKDKNKKRDVSPVPSVSASASPAASPAMTPEKNKTKRDEKTSPAATPAASISPATTPADIRDNGRDKKRERPVDAEKPARTDKPKPKEKPPMPPDTTINSAPPPPATQPPKPEARQERPAPADLTRPDVSAEKPKKDKAAEPAQPPKNEPAIKEKPAPPGPAANAPANPPARDEGKKHKKNEPTTSPTP